MVEIVGAVARVNNVMQENSQASTVQSQGIGDVHHSVDALDRMTQQNAALVEQSAAAAEALHDQALRLNQLVGTFQLSAG